MHILRTFDQRPIQQIYSCPSILDKMRVDNFDVDNLFTPNFQTKIYLLGYDDGVLIGMFILEPFTNISVKVHGAVLPEHTKLARTFVEECCIWIEDNTNIEHLISETPSKHLKTANFISKCGFNHVGVFSKNIKIDGQYYDLIIKERKLWKD